MQLEGLQTIFYFLNNSSLFVFDQVMDLHTLASLKNITMNWAKLKLDLVMDE